MQTPYRAPCQCLRRTVRSLDQRGVSRSVDSARRASFPSPCHGVCRPLLLRTKIIKDWATNWLKRRLGPRASAGFGGANVLPGYSTTARELRKYAVFEW